MENKKDEFFDYSDYFCPPNHKMVESTIIPKLDSNGYSIRETKSLIIEKTGTIIYVYKKKDYLKRKFNKPIKIIQSLFNLW